MKAATAESGSRSGREVTSRGAEGRHKVAFLTSTTVFSGGDKHTIELIQRLDLKKFEPVICCFGHDNYSPTLNDRLGLGVRVVTGFQMKRFGRTWRGLWRERPRTVIIVSGEVTAFPWYHYLAARLAGAARVHAIYHNFSHIPPAPGPEQPWLRRAAVRALGSGARARLRARLTARISDHSIAVSEGVRRQLTENFGFPPARTLTVLNGVDLPYFAQAVATAQLPQAPPGGAEVVVAAVCRLVPVKGVEVLLEAVALLAGELPELRCVIVGEGPAAIGLQAKAAELRLGDRVAWAGFQSDVRPYLQVADIFVNPSSREWVECLPLAVLEAMASGLPCVAARAGGVPELITDGEHGYLFAPGSVEEMASALRRLARDAAGRRRMGERARARARQEFDIERSMGRIQSALLGE